MNPAQHFDLSVEQLDDGTVRLSQIDYSGNSATIDIHPDQIRAIAAQFAPPAIQITTTPADVVLRRFRSVVQAVRGAAWKEWIYDDIWRSCDDDTANALYVGLNAAMVLADQFIEDSESVITVTRNAVTDEHVTRNATRQASYRARKKAAGTPSEDAPESRSHP